MDIYEARRRVRKELVEHLTDALKEVGAYADIYVESVLTNPRSVAVRPPRAMHPLMARMVRDIALDVLAAERVVPSAESATVEV